MTDNFLEDEETEIMNIIHTLKDFSYKEKKDKPTNEVIETFATQRSVPSIIGTWKRRLQPNKGNQGSQDFRVQSSKSKRIDEDRKRKAVYSVGKMNYMCRVKVYMERVQVVEAERMRENIKQPPSSARPGRRLNPTTLDHDLS